MTNNDFLSTYDDILLPKDVQQILHIGRSSLYKLLNNGTIKGFKVGNAYRISKIELKKFINHNNILETEAGYE